MADQPSLSKTFAQAADREMHDLEQKLVTLNEEQRRHVFEQEEANSKASEGKKQELKQREVQDLLKEEELIRRQRPQQVLTPYGNVNQTVSILQVREQAERNVRANHKTELDTFEKDLNRNLMLLIASYARDKQRELDENREKMQELAEQIRQEREKTLLDKDRDHDRSEKEPARDDQSRDDDLHKRVANRIRKAKERDERGKDRDDHERD